AMDRESAQNANALLENEPNAAVLEITMTGPVLTFTENAWVAFSGAIFPIYIDQNIASTNTPIWVKAGQELRFGTLEKGVRLYMAIKGGFLNEPLLGSRSMQAHLSPIIKLEKGMELQHRSGEKDQAIILEKKSNTPLGVKKILAFQGPEFKYLNPEQQEGLNQQTFKVSNLNNRMAYQLLPSLSAFEKNQITGPVLPGTVQITPSGNIMVLMREAQTTGGYPRILQLTQESINALAQLKTGDSFRIKILPLN
ncbi:biotin-dependent carboxyltransferase family protein, partial [Flavobacteriaceae bacterium]|nr:biotin-dependent carboxyltransferase family protein [Flavobacteriaceae bacterium]